MRGWQGDSYADTLLRDNAGESFTMSEFTLDEIGHWSEVKLAIIREYAKPYSEILAKQHRLYHVYIDGFAGAGMHISKRTKAKVAGSPLNVTSISPRFREHHLVELDPEKADHLRGLFDKDEAVVSVKLRTFDSLLSVGTACCEA